MGGTAELRAKIGEYQRSNSNGKRIAATVLVDLNTDLAKRMVPYNFRGHGDEFAAVKQLISESKGRGFPVLFIKYGECGIIPELLTLAQNPLVIPVPTMSAFSNPEFFSALSERGVNTLLLGGYHAGACVLATAKEALHSGFSVISGGGIMLINNDEHLGNLEERMQFYFKPNGHALTFCKNNTELFNLVRGLSPKSSESFRPA